MIEVGQKKHKSNLSFGTYFEKNLIFIIKKR
jgi:hypothetical protein